MDNEEKIQRELGEMFIERDQCRRQGHNGAIMSSRSYPKLPHHPLSVTQNCVTCGKVFKGIILDSDSKEQLKAFLEQLI